MILSFGGRNWCRTQLTRIQGSNKDGQTRFAADGALELYSELFDREETVRCTCEDYASGAAPEVAEQEEDMRADPARKIQVPTLVMWSEGGLGAKFSSKDSKEGGEEGKGGWDGVGGGVAGIWKRWVGDGVELRAVPIGEGYGHYLPEEAAPVVVREVQGWIGRFV